MQRSLAVLLLSLIINSITFSLVDAILISVKYPAESSIFYLRGDSCGLNWNTGLKMTAKGDFTWILELNCPDTLSQLEVKALLQDKVWMLGANHHIDLNSELSGNNGTQSFNFYPWFYGRSGTTRIKQKVYSKELNNFRDVIFYLPPSYMENTLKVHKNILIMHDGQNLFDPATAFLGNSWLCQNTLNDLIVNGRMDEVIVVGPYNTADRIDEYTYVYDASEGGGGKGDLYLDWIESTLIPLVETQFRVEIHRNSLGILGSSLGGLISCYAAWTRPTVYGKVGCMSSSFWWDDNDYQNNVVTLKSVPEEPKPKFYMDSGDTVGGEASCGVYTKQIRSAMIDGGFIDTVNVYQYTDQGGVHSETSWGARFYVPMEYLYPPSTV